MNDTVIFLYKAQGNGAEETPVLHVHACETAPELHPDGGEGAFRDFMTRNLAFYDDQAKKLFDALLKTLPGGTIDALLVQLLDHKRSIFRVLHDDPRTRVLRTEASAERLSWAQIESRAKRIVVGSVVDVYRWEVDLDGKERLGNPVDFHGVVKAVDGADVFVENVRGEPCRTTRAHCKLADDVRDA